MISKTSIFLIKKNHFIVHQISKTYHDKVKQSLIYLHHFVPPNPPVEWAAVI